MDTLGPLLTKLAAILTGLQIALAAQTAATYTIFPNGSQRPTTAQIYAQAPLLRRAAACESTGDVNGTPREFLASGAILWGQEASGTETVIVKRDCGELQINTAVWGRYPGGLDVCGNESDNVYEGWIIYNTINPKTGKKLGMSPWSASQSCWAPPVDNSTSSGDIPVEK